MLVFFISVYVIINRGDDMIIEYSSEYFDQYKKLIKELWNDISEEEIIEITNEHLKGKEFIFLYKRDNKIIGFINTTIRKDYVEGSSSSGVGYIEGIYVCESYRRNQVAISLIKHVISIFSSIGITELGSDTELENEISQFFHKAVGFKEVSKIVHYIMRIGD
jgi:aminoglycoside 6'-N-acetyltransferase I